MARAVVGRHREKARLSEALESSRSELIAVYGRRRIGKTYLIREYYKQQIIFSFTGLQSGSRSDQIENFMIKLNEVTDDFREEQPETWLEALHLLKKFLSTVPEKGVKKVVFIDEFPWVDSHKSKFLPAFENFWNDYCTTRDDLIVVVCGSAASYIINNIIHNKGGLYNRITQKINLEPFDLHETEAFLTYKKVKMKRPEIAKLYMALGGVAEYLEHVKPGDSVVTAIDHICFDKRAPLKGEFDKVFKSLFDEGTYHEKIIHVLAKAKKRGITREEIIDAMGITSSGRFSEYLEELIQSSFVMKYDAYKNNRKVNLYRIQDEFFLFHLQFISKYKGNSWKQLYTKQAYKSWVGFAFETICLKHVEAIKRAIRCDQIESVNYPWSNKKAQIDLVIDRNDGIINLVEMKFYNTLFTIDNNHYQKLLHKESQFVHTTKTKKSIHNVMLTSMGLNHNANSNGLITKSVTIDALFNADYL